MEIYLICYGDENEYDVLGVVSSKEKKDKALEIISNKVANTDNLFYISYIVDDIEKHYPKFLSSVKHYLGWKHTKFSKWSINESEIQTYTLDQPYDDFAFESSGAYWARASALSKEDALEKMNRMFEELDGT